MKKVILIGLDGVFCNIPEYEVDEIPSIKTGVRKFLLRLKLTGQYKIVLFTHRKKEVVQKWLEINDISKLIDNITNKYLSNYLYVDTRVLTFKNDFEKLFNQIENFPLFIEM